MIGRIPSLRPTLRAIRWHHERLDGSGYPDGLTAAQIPLEARILAVADVYDAMSSGRSYRPALPVAAVLSHLETEAGRLYDPRCVEAVATATTVAPSSRGGAIFPTTPRLVPSGLGQDAGGGA